MCGLLILLAVSLCFIFVYIQYRLELKRKLQVAEELTLTSMQRIKQLSAESLISDSKKLELELKTRDEYVNMIRRIYGI